MMMMMMMMMMMRMNEKTRAAGGQWTLAQQANAGSTTIIVEDQANLAVGDILEVSAGTPEAEVITITHFFVGACHCTTEVSRPCRRSHQRADRRSRRKMGTTRCNSQRCHHEHFADDFARR